MIEVIGPKDKNFDLYGKQYFNVTSHSTDFCKELSPFFLGPCKLYRNFQSKNMENAWQYSKVYKKHLDENNGPSLEYFKWAYYGWNSEYAHRYPMGKGSIPEYSFWNGEHLDYIEARKKIYIPLYSECARKTDAFQKLKRLNDDGIDLVLWDFDGRNTKESMDEIINNPYKKCGHGFVIKMMLLGMI